VLHLHLCHAADFLFDRRCLLDIVSSLPFLRTATVTIMPPRGADRGQGHLQSSRLSAWFCLRCVMPPIFFLIGVACWTSCLLFLSCARLRSQSRHREAQIVAKVICGLHDLRLVLPPLRHAAYFLFDRRCLLDIVSSLPLLHMATVTVRLRRGTDRGQGHLRSSRLAPGFTSAASRETIA
jgi:hypothetical protein